MDQFVFEVLVIFVESLALAHSDEQSLGNKCYTSGRRLHPRIDVECLCCIVNVVISALETFVSSKERCSSAAAPLSI